MEMKTATLSSARLKLVEVQYLVREGSLIESFEILEEALGLIEEYLDEITTEIEISL